MNLQIALSPQLNMSPDEFARAWNSYSETQKQARARVQTQSKGFDPAGGIGLVFLEGLAMGLLTNAVYDLIKELLIKGGVKKRIKTTEITQPDGTRIIVVEEEEG